jgi:hypothetical protein
LKAKPDVTLTPQPIATSWCWEAYKDLEFENRPQRMFDLGDACAHAEGDGAATIGAADRPEEASSTKFA